MSKEAALDLLSRLEEILSNSKTLAHLRDSTIFTRAMFISSNKQNHV